MSFVFPKAKGAAWRQEVNWLRDDVRAALVTKDYAPEPGTEDEFFSDIPPEAVIQISNSLPQRAILKDVLDSAKIKFPVVVGDKVNAMVIFQRKADEKTSRLLMYIDVINGFPFIANGSDVEVDWPSDNAQRIVRL